MREELTTGLRVSPPPQVMKTVSADGSLLFDSESDGEGDNPTPDQPAEQPADQPGDGSAAPPPGVCEASAADAAAAASDPPECGTSTSGPFGLCRDDEDVWVRLHQRTIRGTGENNVALRSILLQRCRSKVTQKRLKDFLATTAGIVSGRISVESPMVKEAAEELVYEINQLGLLPDASLLPTRKEIRARIDAALQSHLKTSAPVPAPAPAPGESTSQPGTLVERTPQQRSAQKRKRASDTGSDPKRQHTDEAPAVPIASDTSDQAATVPMPYLIDDIAEYIQLAKELDSKGNSGFVSSDDVCRVRSMMREPPKCSLFLARMKQLQQIAWYTNARKYGYDSGLTKKDLQLLRSTAPKLPFRPVSRRDINDWFFTQTRNRAHQYIKYLYDQSKGRCHPVGDKMYELNLRLEFKFGRIDRYCPPATATFLADGAFPTPRAFQGAQPRLSPPCADTSFTEYLTNPPMGVKSTTLNLRYGVKPGMKFREALAHALQTKNYSTELSKWCRHLVSNDDSKAEYYYWSPMDCNFREFLLPHKLHVLGVIPPTPEPASAPTPAPAPASDDDEVEAVTAPKKDFSVIDLTLEDTDDEDGDDKCANAPSQPADVERLKKQNAELQTQLADLLATHQKLETCQPKCPVCQMVKSDISDPLEALACGHLVCRSCRDVLFSQAILKCPVCTRHIPRTSQTVYM